MAWTSENGPNKSKRGAPAESRLRQNCPPTIFVKSRAPQERTGHTTTNDGPLHEGATSLFSGTRFHEWDQRGASWRCHPADREAGRDLAGEHWRAVPDSKWPDRDHHVAPVTRQELWLSPWRVIRFRGREPGRCLDFPQTPAKANAIICDRGFEFYPKVTLFCFVLYGIVPSLIASA